MPSTPVFALPYPGRTDDNDMQAQVEDLAEAIDIELSDIHDGFSMAGNLTVQTVTMDDASLQALTVNGPLTLSSGASVTGDAAVSGDILFDGLFEVNSRYASIHMGHHNKTTSGFTDTSLGGSGTGTGTETEVLAISSLQELVSGRLYIVDIEAEFKGTEVGDRIRFRFYDTAVGGGGTLWSGQYIQKVHSPATVFSNVSMRFWHLATSTRTPGTFHLAGTRFSAITGGNTVTARINPNSYFQMRAEVGDGAVIENL